MARRLTMEPGALFEYEEWLDEAKNGETLVYWVGSLVHARSVEIDPDDRSLTEERKRLGALQITSARIFFDAKRKAVALTQKRLEDGVYEYRATRRRSDEPRSTIEPTPTREIELVDA